jgi:hypothetical protein
LAVTVISVGMVAAIVLVQSLKCLDARGLRRSLMAAATVTAMGYTGLVLQFSLQRSENVASQVAELKQRLPNDAQLFSFGLIETMFTYHYGEPVTMVPTALPKDIPADMEYFCLAVHDQMQTPRLPFPWKQEAVISCDRWKHEHPERWVVVGRRLNETMAHVSPDERLQP